MMFCSVTNEKNEGRLPSVCLTVIAHWWKQIKGRKQYVNPRAKIEASATKKEEKKDFKLFRFRQLISLNVQFMKGCYLWNTAWEGCIAECISLFLHECTQLSVHVGFYVHTYIYYDLCSSRYCKSAKIGGRLWPNGVFTSDYHHTAPSRIILCVSLPLFHTCIIKSLKGFDSIGHFQ